MSESAKIEKQNPRYEAMFLLPQSGASDPVALAAELKTIFDRAHAEVELLAKWDERKLAYPVDGQKRGFYVIAYFRAPGPSLALIERDCNLSETILRAMVLRADHIGDVELEVARKEFPDLTDVTAVTASRKTEESEAEAPVASDTEDVETEAEAETSEA